MAKKTKATAEEYEKALREELREDINTYSAKLKNKKYKSVVVKEQYDLPEFKKSRNADLQEIDVIAMDVFKENYGPYIKDTMTQALRHFLPQDVYDEAGKRLDKKINN